MRRRPSARLLILDPERRLLLMRFEHTQGALAGSAYWATPGGGLEPGETFEQAALRELHEETGIVAQAVGDPIARREFEMQMPDGERVVADERLYVVNAPSAAVSREGWTDLERQVMADHRWWTAEALRATSDIVWPDDLPALLATAGWW